MRPEFLNEFHCGQHLSLSCTVLPLSTVEHLAAIRNRPNLQLAAYLLLLVKDPDMTTSDASVSSMNVPSFLGKAFLCEFKCCFSLGIPLEVEILFDQSIHWLHQFAMSLDEHAIIIRKT